MPAAVIESRSPQDPNDLVTTVACADRRAIERAVDISNGVPYGLATSMFTSALDHALELVARVDTGLIRVNQPTSGVDFHAPFGGQKQSSIGPREQGKQARELYTSLHTITIMPTGHRQAPRIEVPGP
jgi:alpha-ketoglutaric semialdehyde dehydrogenase